MTPICPLCEREIQPGAAVHVHDARGIACFHQACWERVTPDDHRDAIIEQLAKDGKLK